MIFRINKHKSSVSASEAHRLSLGPCEGCPVDHPRLAGVIVTVVDPVDGSVPHRGGWNGGDNYVFRGHRRGGTRGTMHRSVVARGGACHAHSTLEDHRRQRLSCIMRSSTRTTLLVHAYDSIVSLIVKLGGTGNGTRVIAAAFRPSAVFNVLTPAITEEKARLVIIPFV